MPKESAAKKVAKKKVVKKVAKKTTQRAPKKRAASSSMSIKRKAPTRTSVKQEKSAVLNKSKKGILIGVLVLFVITAGSVTIGMSDTGEIGVAEVVSQKANKLIETGDIAAAERITIPKKESVTRSNGGLSGKGKPSPPIPPPVPVASSTASTTDGVFGDSTEESDESVEKTDAAVEEAAVDSIDEIIGDDDSEGA